VEKAIFRQFCALLDTAPFTYNGWEAPSFHCLAGQTVECTVRLIYPVDDGSCPLPITPFIPVR